jgi:hypothetical protein
MTSTERPTSTLIPVGATQVPSTTLSGGLVHLFATSGVMKSAVQAAMKAITLPH